MSSNFDAREIYVQSTDVDRTIMSAASHLRGLYPENEFLIFSDSEQEDEALPPFNVEKSSIKTDVLPFK